MYLYDIKKLIGSNHMILDTVLFIHWLMVYTDIIIWQYTFIATMKKRQKVWHISNIIMTYSSHHQIVHRVMLCVMCVESLPEDPGMADWNVYEVEMVHPIFDQQL